MLLTIESDGQECQYDRGRIVGKIILYHGSPNETVMPKFEHFDALQSVVFTEFNEKYNNRDTWARENMRKLIDSDRNRVIKVFSTLL